MRWLCDEMLARLARLMRAAGEDVVLAGPSAPDADLLAQAAREGRRLVTRDRALAARAGEGTVLVRSDAVMDQAAEIAALGLADRRGARFTRCLVDNAELRPAEPDQIAALPAQTRSLAGPFRVCPACGRTYWPGSHVRRLAERLDRLAEMSDASP